ncbi:3096_t:CDS:10 [Acaulospora colombiana]|uniref:3096_t:CDS:1 n=1 Tax=Acaulospora colombiana TaxID=27376 RepID=A0ACA9JYV4_9GLOM|nr:3096_t:CDS:10 [Acaulospora colombiana]
MKLEIASRPKERGTAGTKVKLIANFLEITFKFPDVEMHNLEVRQQKNEAKKREKGEVFSKMSEDKVFGPNPPAYDGSVIYSRKRLCDGKGREHEVVLASDGSSKRYRATIEHIRTFKLKPMQEYIKEISTQRWDETIQTSLRILNSFLNTTPHAKYQTFNKAIFPPVKNKAFLPGGIELLKGYCQKIRPGWGRLFANVDIYATTCYPSMPVVEIIPRILSKKKDDLIKGLDAEDIKIINKFFRDVRIKTIYRTQPNKEYKVQRISSHSADDEYFRIRGERKNITKYYQEWGMNLQYPKLPCIVIKEKRPEDCHIPLEFCAISPGQKYPIDKLSRIQRQSMIEQTVIAPSTRFSVIKKAIDNYFKHQSDPALRSIGMEVSPEFSEVDGRVLDPPKITTSDKFAKSAYLQPAHLKDWVVYVFDKEVPMEHIDTRINILIEVLTEKGMTATRPRTLISENPQGNLKYIFGKVSKNPPQLIVCIIPKRANGGSTLYPEIKEICSTDLGIPTQAIIGMNMRDKQRWKQICYNLALKINTKLGGTNVKLAENELNFKSEKYIVFGADVFHPGDMDKKRGHPSVAAICASMDKDVTKYFARYSINLKLKNEMIEDIRDMAIDLLEQYRKRNNYLPDHIIFYRDGVAEGQFKNVLDEELKPLYAELERYYKGHKQETPKLTYIIVQKRHHARPSEEENADKNGNCKPGTIVDSVIVVPQHFTFFLQSHTALRGTARPAYYHVILNGGEFTADEMQNLTNKLCYLSARCNTPISLVTPVHYAHNIANLVKHFVKYDEQQPQKAKPGRGRQSVPSTFPEHAKNASCPAAASNIENKMHFV